MAQHSVGNAKAIRQGRRDANVAVMKRGTVATQLPALVGRVNFFLFDVASLTQASFEQRTHLNLES